MPIQEMGFIQFYATGAFFTALCSMGLAEMAEVTWKRAAVVTTLHALVWPIFWLALLFIILDDRE